MRRLSASASASALICFFFVRGEAREREERSKKKKNENERGSREGPMLLLLHLLTFSALSRSFSASFWTNSLTSSAPTWSLIISASVSWTTSSPSLLEEGGEAKARWLCRRRRLSSRWAGCRREEEEARSPLLETTEAAMPLLRGRARAHGAARGSREAAIIVRAREKVYRLFVKASFFFIRRLQSLFRAHRRRFKKTRRRFFFQTSLF